MSNKKSGEISIAIIGAGLAGISLAEMLSEWAVVSLFEKSRGVSGRMATRYTETHQFDHGAQYFVARSKAFQRQLAPFIESGVVQEWSPYVITLGDSKKQYKRDWFEPHYVAVPRMNTLCKAMARDKNVLLNEEVETLQKRSDGWFVKTSQGREYGPFDWLVSTVPAPQAAHILPDTFSGYSHIVETKMMPCYSLMLSLGKRLETNWQAAVVKNSSISWVAIDSSKPERMGVSILVHSSNEWAEAHVNDDKENVQHSLLLELEKIMPCDLSGVKHVDLHRWLYANTVLSPEENSLLDEQLKIGVCGDWLIEGRVESAFLSALDLFRKMQNQWVNATD